MLLERLLREAGYACVASTMNPHEVCALHRKNRYDLILLDLQMPDMDGFQVMEGLKINAVDDYLPVLVLTAQPSHKLLEQKVLERTAELRESEARFRSLTELASDWYWEQDENMKFTKVSGPVLEMLGIKVGAVNAETAGVPAAGWNEAEREALKATIAARQPFLDFVFHRINADGSRQQFRVSGEPMFNESCRFLGCRGIGVEMSATK